MNVPVADPAIASASTLDFLIDTIKTLIEANAKYSGQTPTVQLNADTSIESAGVDSFDFIEVVFKIEDHFGIEIDHNANKSFDPTITLGQLAAEIDRLIVATPK